MKVKYVNKGKLVRGLTLGKEYEVINCIISGWSSKVTLINDFGEKLRYESVLFDKKFQKELIKAIEELQSDYYKPGDAYEVFIKDFN